MSGKGSRKRPQQISEEEAEANWSRIFGKKDKNNDLLNDYKEELNHVRKTRKEIRQTNAK